MMQKLQNWYHSLLSDEDVLEMWSALMRYRSGYPQWAQADDVQTAILNSASYSPDKEREIAAEVYYAFRE